jgi:hypothetical protein
MSRRHSRFTLGLVSALVFDAQGRLHVTDPADERVEVFDVD